MQDVNEKSFKLLQEYLSAANDHLGHGGSASLPYKFTFFLPEPSQNEQSLSGEDESLAHVESSQVSLQQISLTLPPPVRNKILFLMNMLYMT